MVHLNIHADSLQSCASPLLTLPTSYVTSHDCCFCAQVSMKCNASLLNSSRLPWDSTCCCGELITAFMQVISYVAELLAKVHEQQAQAERIVGFQSLFKCVYYPVRGCSLLSKLPASVALLARCIVHRTKACIDSSTGSGVDASPMLCPLFLTGRHGMQIVVLCQCCSQIKLADIPVANYPPVASLLQFQYAVSTHVQFFPALDIHLAWRGTKALQAGTALLTLNTVTSMATARPLTM